jgi:D-glycero-D-manno-heptose 1,7-bisphosphate phosphatase
LGTKIVFLDRDGVINKLVERDGQQVSPRTFEDFEILPGVISAINELKKNRFEVVVVTNQPDITRGLMKIDELEKMHKWVHSLGVHEIRFCPHSGENNCECRKPKAGMLNMQLMTYAEAPFEKWMIGDSETDVTCGHLVGARTIRIARGARVDSLAEYIAEDLKQAVRYVVSAQSRFGTVNR